MPLLMALPIINSTLSDHVEGKELNLFCDGCRLPFGRTRKQQRFVSVHSWSGLTPYEHREGRTLQIMLLPSPSSAPALTGAR